MAAASCIVSSRQLSPFLLGAYSLATANKVRHSLHCWSKVMCVFEGWGWGHIASTLHAARPGHPIPHLAPHMEHHTPLAAGQPRLGTQSSQLSCTCTSIRRADAVLLPQLNAPPTLAAPGGAAKKLHQTRQPAAAPSPHVFMIQEVAVHDCKARIFARLDAHACRCKTHAGEGSQGLRAACMARACMAYL